MRRGDNLANSIALSEEGTLALAFQKFSEASQKLEERYDALRIEAEALRAEIREKDAAIKRSEKLATLGETAAAIAHEVRNPLGAIKLFLSLLKEDLVQRPDSLQMVTEIDKSVGVIDHVVSNILQFARTRSLPFAPVNVVSIIQEQLGILTARKDAALQIVTKFEGSPFIAGHEHSLRQVFHNLLVNAAQVMKYRGKITISTSDGPNQSLRISIQDTGPGVDPAIRNKLFEPFVSTRNEGTGLGLAIVKRIVEEHSGSISVVNDGGAKFTVELPRGQNKI